MTMRRIAAVGKAAFAAPANVLAARASDLPPLENPYTSMPSPGVEPRRGLPPSGF
jgi:hypothetical protein